MVSQLYSANERHLPGCTLASSPPAVSRRRHRHPLRRLDLDRLLKRNRLRQYQSEVTNNFRIITLQLYYCGELGERQQHRYYYYVSGIFGQGMVGLGWTLISDIALKIWRSLTGGIFNFCANMASIIAH